MITLSVPCIFSKELLPVYDAINRDRERTGVCVDNAYGALPGSHSARETDRTPRIDFGQLVRYAELLRDCDVRFSYTLNSTSITLSEIQKTIDPFLRRLHDDAGIDSLTISSPLLVEYIRRKLPNIPFFISLSTIANVISTAQLRQAYDFGADRVVLGLQANRNMRLLESVAEMVDDDHSVALLVNEFCGNCLIRPFHYHWESMSEYTCMDPDDKFFGSYPYNVCEPIWLAHVSSVLKTYWVLPQWLTSYQKYNIHSFKISGRTHLDPVWHRYVLEQYTRKNFHGNVMSLAPHDNCSTGVNIDSDALEGLGYFAHFREMAPRCADVCGVSCHFCDEMAQKLTLKRRSQSTP